ncbi:MAG: spheroidene monooxygenase [Pseudomonadota bacterium]|nr:spheroidene monooxygenase [Pseudomonadota bacterium]
MGLARFYLSKISDISFYKLFGTGSDDGFTFKINPFTNTGVYAILAVWQNKGIAEEIIHKDRLFRKYRDYSCQNWTIYLDPISVKGVWNGKKPFRCTEASADGRIVALTRATIKIRTMMNFWRKVPNVQKMIAADENVLFKIGLGEVPLFNQVTFSIWPDAESMNTFARKNGPHAEAIKAVRRGKWFSEELYARFIICGEHGEWSRKSSSEERYDKLEAS